MKSVQDWPGASIPIRSFVDFRDLAVLIGGPDPAADPNAWYSAQHHQHARGVYAGTGIEEFLAIEVDHLRRQHHRPHTAGDGLCATAARGVLRSHRQAGRSWRLRSARTRGHPGAQAPAARGRQDRDLRRRAGEGHRRVQRHDLAAADGRARRPAASFPASSTR